MRLAPVPPCPSVLPPGAGNEEAEKAVKTGKKRAKQTEEGYVVEAGAVQRDLDAPTVARHGDRDVAAILAIEQTQRGLLKPAPSRPGWCRAVYEPLRDRATTRTAPAHLGDSTSSHLISRLEIEIAAVQFRRKRRDRRSPDGLDPRSGS